MFKNKKEKEPVTIESLTTELDENKKRYKKFYELIITPFKGNDLDDEMGAMPKKKQVDIKNPPPTGTYTQSGATTGGQRTVTWCPLLVYDEKNDGLIEGPDLKNTLDSQHSDQGRVLIANQDGVPINLFKLNYSHKNVLLHIQKHGFCRELNEFLRKKNHDVKPTDLDNEIKRLQKNYPRALEGAFSQTKKIVDQLMKKAEELNPNDPLVLAKKKKSIFGHKK